jgi:hypothetical protein
MYGKALEDFFRWREKERRPAFTRGAVRAHHAALEAGGYAPSTLNQRLAAIRRGLQPQPAAQPTGGSTYVRVIIRPTPPQALTEV